MYIQGNQFYQPQTKVIKPYNCSMIATDGPNIVEKLNLSGLEINYDNVNVTKIKLPAGKKDFPLFSQEQSTYILIKVNYDTSNPLCLVQEENYIEYYFSDSPTEVRYIGQLMVLTGNINHKLPKIYLNNTGTKDVWLDIMSANIISDTDQEMIDVIRIENLYYNSIISDNIGGISTELQVLDATSSVVLILPYMNIASVNNESNNIIIQTNSNETIILMFLNEFNMYQALSRIDWVRKDSNNRYLTVSSPSPDVTPPVITYLNTGYTFQTSALTISDLKTYYLSSVTDNRDGDKSIDDVNIYIFELNQNQLLTGITHEGEYTLVFEVYDIAHNKTSNTINIIVDQTPPIIYFTNVALGTGFTMNLTADTATPGTINKSDINLKSIDSVIDLIDGVIPNSAVTITISGNTGLINSITDSGNYYLTYNVSDRVGNTLTTGKTLYVPDTILPIIHFNTGLTNTMSLTDYSGEIFINDIINYYINNITDNVDGSIPLINVSVLINGVLQTSITSSTNYTIDFIVSDSNNNTRIETVILTVIL